MPNWAQTPPLGTVAAIAGDIPVALWNAESVTAPQTSQAAALVNAQGVIGQVTSFGADLKFDGAPGTFEVDVEAAPDNVDGDFYAIDKITTVNTNNAWHSDYSGVSAKLVRFRLVSLANSVKTTAKITR